MPLIENNWLDTALTCESQQQIEEWVHAYLLGSGNNVPLSDGLKLIKRYWIGPIQYQIDALERICGPEKHMEYKQDPEGWEVGIASMIESLKEGWTPAPFILTGGRPPSSALAGSQKFTGSERYFECIESSVSVAGLC